MSFIVRVIGSLSVQVQFLLLCLLMAMAWSGFTTFQLIENTRDLVGEHPQLLTDLTLLKQTLIVSLAVAVVTMLMVMLRVMRPLRKITQATRALAQGDKSIQIPSLKTVNEMGDIARAVQVFRESMLENERMMEERNNEQQAQGQRKQDMDYLINIFDESARQSLANSNMEAVASATNELSSSVIEIRNQVSHSATIASQASGEAQRTRDSVQNLAKSSQKVVDVTTMINDISEQINLLALNAAIEAARAGESGRGFAVVADEVKKLSSQTANATKEIEAHIQEMAGASEQAVTTMNSVCQVIEQINDISASLNTSFEQQTEATTDISRNIDEQADRFHALKQEIETFLQGIKTV